MVKFRGSKPECVRGKQIATVHRIEQNSRGVIHIFGELGMIPGHAHLAILTMKLTTLGQG